MTEIVAADVGGTHVRFAIAEAADGHVRCLGEAFTFLAAEHPSLESAWQAFGKAIGRAPPRAAALAVASPIDGEVLKLTNNPWVIRPTLIPEKLGVDRYTVVNDFGAVAHAVAQLDAGHLHHMFGPQKPLSETAAVSVIGPGTGLGVAQFIRHAGGYRVVEAEGGHADFAPVDPLEDQILTFLRRRHKRVSVERVVSGPGLVNIYQALATVEGRAAQICDDKLLWTAALDGADSLAAAALERFCLSFGAVCGDVALTHGSGAVVLAGGLTARLVDRLSGSGFYPRFLAKGRLESRMAALPIHRVTHSQPGLFGAAAAFAMEHGN